MPDHEEINRTTKDAILDAATDLFIAHGFEATPMDAIAASAKVAKGTLYYHFSSKEGIVEAIVERYTQSMEKAFNGIEANTSQNPLEKLASYNGVMEKINSAAFSKLHRMKYIDIHKKTLHALVTHIAPYYARVIEEGTGRGLWKITHPLELAEILISASSYLFDPENANERSARRVSAFIDLCARVIEVEPETLAPAFRFFSEPGNGEPTSNIEEHTT